MKGRRSCLSITGRFRRGEPLHELPGRPAGPPAPAQREPLRQLLQPGPLHRDSRIVRQMADDRSEERRVGKECM